MLTPFPVQPEAISDDAVRPAELSSSASLSSRRSGHSTRRRGAAFPLEVRPDANSCIRRRNEDHSRPFTRFSLEMDGYDEKPSNASLSGKRDPPRQRHLFVFLVEQLQRLRPASQPA